MVVQIVLTEDLALEAHSHGEYGAPSIRRLLHQWSQNQHVAPNQTKRIEIVVQVEADPVSDHCTLLKGGLRHIGFTHCELYWRRNF